MHQIEIQAIDYNKEIPSDISELSKDQFLDFLSYFLRYRSGEISYDHFRIGLVNVFIQFREPLKKIKQEDKENVLSEIYRLSELMDSFTTEVIEDGVTSREVNISFIKNLIPYFHIGDDIFHGPKDALTDITFQEYIDARHWFAEYRHTQEISALDHLVATLYRPERPHYNKEKMLPTFNGQHREAYNPHTVETRVPLVAGKSLLVKYGIYLFFSGCEQFLHDGEIPLGGETIKFKDLYSASNDGQSDGTGLVGVLFSMAESHVFGNVKETAETNLYDVMVRLYQLVRQQQKPTTPAPALW